MMQNKNIIIFFFFLITSVLIIGLSYSPQPADREGVVKGKVVYLTLETPQTETNGMYSIYRAKANSDVQEIDPIRIKFDKISTVTEPAYEDKGAAEGKNYFYSVASIDAKGMENAGSNYINIWVGDTYDNEENEIVD